MKLHTIENLNIPELADYTQLTDVALRRVREPDEGLYLAESPKVIERALRSGHTPRSVLTLAEWIPKLEPLLTAFPEVPVYVGTSAQLEELTGFHMHRGALASMHRPVMADPLSLLRSLESDAPEGKAHFRIAILEGLTDHTNVGACFRSAAALGVDAVFVTPDCADPLYRRSVRVSMGTVFQIPWTRIERWPSGMETLQSEGYVVAGMTLGEGAITLDALAAENHQKLALVFGSEGHGIRAVTDRRLDRRVTIPMMGGVDSLNVAAASAVAFYGTK